MRILKLISETLPFIFIAFWSYVGLSKLMDHQTFSRQLFAEGMSEAIANLFSYVIPIIAIAASAAVIFSGTRKVGLALSSVMLLTFSIYIGYIVFFVTPLPCSCILLTDELSWKEHYYISCILLLLNIYLVTERVNVKDKVTERVPS